MLVTHGVPSSLAEVLADLARGDAVLDPEVADAGVGLRQGEAARRLRMREAGRVEVQAVLVGLGPIDPVREMLRAQLVAIDLAAAGFGVHGVQVQAMLARDQAVDLVEIAAQLVGGARLAGIVARGRDAAAQLAADVLEAAHVIALPAVQAERDRR